MLGFCAVGAAAADMPVKAAPPSAAAAFSWTGCYMGGYVGGATGSRIGATEPVTATGLSYNIFAPYSYRTSGSFIGGGTLGCNWQPTKSPFVLGIEGEVGHIRFNKSVIDPNSALGGSDTLSTTTVGDWYAVVAGRLGYAFDRTLWYAKVGPAFTDNRSSVIDTCTAGACGPATLTASGRNSVGFAAGTGIEHALFDHWTIKAEYLWLDFGHYSVCGPGGAAAAGLTFCASYNTGGVHTGKLGLNYKF
jgi:outer membrane immunogenic protein